jgi:hypothetical protein
VDIGGHPPIPTGSKQSSGNLLFLVVFQFLNFGGHFEGLNEVFLGSSTLVIAKGFYRVLKINLLYDTFPTSYHAPQTNIVCQIYTPGKLIHQITQNEFHKIVGFLSFGVGVLDFLYVKKAFRASL